MKKTITSILAIMLCAIIAITGISTETAYAANSTTALKVTFKNKSVTLTDDIEEGIEKVNVKTLTKKWGKPKTEKSEGSTTYTWKKGKSSIRYFNDKTIYSNIWISINDKNVTLMGLKVGMKRDKAAKILKSLGAEDKYEETMTAASTDSRTMITCMFENGKVSCIDCTAYIGKE